MDSVSLMIERQESIAADLARIMPNLKTTGKLQREPVLRRRLQQVEQFRTEFRRRDAEIRLIAKPDLRESLPYFVEHREKSFKEAADDLQDELDALLESLSPSKQSVGEAPALQVTEIQPSVPLPRMELPRFSGAIQEWPSFRDRITSLILRNKRLSDDQRMHYLVSALKGEPLSAIKHLDVCADHLSIAWQILVRQYENERELVFANLKILLTLPSVETSSYEGLRALRESVNTVLHTLRKLERDPDQWNDLLVYVLTDRLDAPSREAWETTIGISKKVPSYKQLDQFLEARVRILQSMSTSPPGKALPTDSVKTKVSSKKSPDNTKRVATLTVENKVLKCYACSQSHKTMSCPKFTKLSVDKRAALIAQAEGCFNCLGKGHFAEACMNRYRCRQCQQRHHTLLHRDKPREEPQETAVETNKTVEASSNSVSRKLVKREKTGILSTARVNCYSSRGTLITVRALIDQGSQISMISENLVQLLRLPRSRDHGSYSGATDIRFRSHGTTAFGLSPVKSTSPCIHADAVIVTTPVRTSERPTVPLPYFSHLQGLPLADPHPLNNDPIDLLLGSELLSAIFLQGVRIGKPTEPMAQETIFGWIISGPEPPGPVAASICINTVSLAPLDDMLTRFWQLEEIPPSSNLSQDEAACEEHFAQTHSRMSDGRYVVRFPFKTTPPPRFANTRSSAYSQLQRLERRLEREPDTAEEYRKFLAEYHNLGHMEVVKERPQSADRLFYIPHHAVVRESSQTTRLRVVFNASARDSSGSSLNESLHPGPRLQIDLTAILLRWRQHRYVLTADIEKMFRQILIHPSETDYQRILWRPSPSKPVEAYRLLTVTYGTTSAPYQSIRVLKQLAEDEGSRYPLATDVINQQTYVDDCLFGADDKRMAIKTRDQAINLLKSGGFRLRKWASNDDDLLADIDPDDHGIANKELRWDETLKILGLNWNPLQDEFQVSFATPDSSVVTKRGILSIIARLFDPLGWLAPIIITAKILIQEIWKVQCDWDAPLPVTIQERWRTFMSRLPAIGQIRIPRWTATRPDSRLELHGFADASIAAYAAVVYLRVTPQQAPSIISLLIAKSKVAPLKTISIPRLELCAAVLLSRLMRFTRESLRLEGVESICWSDSTVTLAWLSQSPTKWKPFVAHRVAKIHEFTEQVSWRYVPTSCNPADCASRGVQPDELSPHPLWWTGPAWLASSPDHWPQISPQVDDGVTLEARSVRRVNAVNTVPPWNLQSRYSSWTRLIRITALMIKYGDRLRRTATETPILPLLSPDLTRARIFWIREIQRDSFKEELAILSKSEALPRKNPLSSMTPFIDDDGILRARGRLIHAPLLPQAKHPILLRAHPLVRLIILETHMRMLHGNLQLTLSWLRQRYWILRVRPLVRSVIYQCVKCTRERAEPASQLMGDLPAYRVTRSTRAFAHTGMDYAGPLSVRLSPGRGSKSRKAYIALFICMATRAIHLELVSDCSANAFIAAYQRFTSRRGVPSDLYSDNSTTYHGAERELSAMFQASLHDTSLKNMTAESGTEWHFIPPASPHFGGLWEAAVRSVKYHLKRCTSTALLTFEELTTLLCKIEACLNSRPLVAMSDCIEDYQCLTPGHFLIGQSITAPPEPSLLAVNENRLDRWQRLHRLTEQFWRAWTKDYVHTLQQRTKWRHVQELAREGRLVFLHEPGIPPSHWSLGRIIECHPGADGLTRVVTIKTQHTTLKRPLTKVTFLPDDINSIYTTQSGMAGGEGHESRSTVSE